MHKTFACRVLLTFFLILFGTKQTYAQIIPTILQQVESKEKMNHWVDSVYFSMSEEERIGQLLILVANSNSTTANKANLKKYIKNQKIGGILFWKGDIIECIDVQNFCQANSKIPMLVTLDAEWGLSMRFGNIGEFPLNTTLGAIDCEEIIYEYAQEVGRQCKEIGANVNFAPVLDVNLAQRNQINSNRLFSSDPENVARKGIAYSKGLESMGVIAVGKHFPGHGSTIQDSHTILPEVNSNRVRLDSVDLYPFKEYIKAGFSGIMTAHLYVPALDNSSIQPSSISKPIVTDLLQKEMNFSGLIITDAMNMKGFQRDKGSAVKAILAGNDMLMVSLTKIESDFLEIMQAVKMGVISKQEIEKKCKKILSYKYAVGLTRYKPIKTEGILNRINTKECDRINKKVFEQAITLLKNDSAIIPIDIKKQKVASLSMNYEGQSAFYPFLKKYADTDSFILKTGSIQKTQDDLFEKLKSYDVVIYSVHDTYLHNWEFLKRLCKEKKVVICFFTFPYQLQYYEQIVTDAAVLIEAYENNDYAMNSAAQAIFGIIPCKGKLSIEIPGLFPYGTGIATKTLEKQ